MSAPTTTEVRERIEAAERYRWPLPGGDELRPDANASARTLREIALPLAEERDAERARADAAEAEVGRLRAEAAKRDALRPYPILGDPALYVPWGLVESAAQRCWLNHEQTPERLAERGGMGWLELAAVLTDKPWRAIRGTTLAEAETIIVARVAAYTTAMSIGPIALAAGLPATATPAEVVARVGEMSRAMIAWWDADEGCYEDLSDLAQRIAADARRLASEAGR